MEEIRVKVRRLQKTYDWEFQEDMEYVEQVLELEPERTAAIVSDMWAEHWCAGATKRVGDLAPQMNTLLSYLRDMGVKIIFCPSGTEATYNKDPRRIELLDKRYFTNACRIPAEEYLFTQNIIPDITARIDPNFVQCDCGLDKKCDCTQKPWTKEGKGQIATLEIKENDLIGMDEENVVSYLKQNGFRYVFMMGVHTNMCVIYRKFGLKALKMQGILPILVRDMTDCMIPREEPPYQDHFTALDHTIRFIEEYICPSTSTLEIMGTEVFTFPDDKRLCQSTQWGSATCEEIFDDYDIYLNRRLLDPVKIRCWIEPPGFSGIELDYYNADIPAHGSRSGIERTITIPFGNYVTKIVAMHGIPNDSTSQEHIIFSLIFFGKPGKDGKKITLGDFNAGEEKSYTDVKEVILEAPANYRMNSITGVFSPNDELNAIAFHSQACRLFELKMKNGKNTVTDLLDYAYKGKLWHAFFINGCWRNVEDGSPGFGSTFEAWIHENADGKTVWDSIKKMEAVRKDNGIKELDRLKAVECRTMDGKTMEVRMAFDYK